jgi:hypothetical protein
MSTATEEGLMETDDLMDAPMLDPRLVPVSAIELVIRLCIEETIL